MSVIIKDMEMPESCLKCPFTYEGDCTADEGLTDVYLLLTERHPKCPLKGLPTPHGRLIDADYLIKVLQDTLDNYSDNYNDGKTVEKLVVALCKQYIDHCPTIIESEGVNE